MAVSGDLPLCDRLARSRYAVAAFDEGAGNAKSVKRQDVVLINVATKPTDIGTSFQRPGQDGLSLRVPA